MDVRLKEKQIVALRLAIMEVNDNQAKYPEIPELAELVEDLAPVLEALRRAKSVTVEV